MPSRIAPSDRGDRMNKRGATAAITALVMVALIGCAGLAVDTARAWLSRTGSRRRLMPLLWWQRAKFPIRTAMRRRRPSFGRSSVRAEAATTTSALPSAIPHHPGCQRFLEDPHLCDCDHPDHAVRGHLETECLLLGLRRGTARGLGARGCARAGPDILDEHCVRTGRRNLQRPRRRSRPCWASSTATRTRS